jgi:LysM repeat protein
MLIILGLVGLILGGSAFFAYELYWKPRRLDREDKRSAAAIQHYSLPAFEKATSLQQQGDIEQARTAWAQFIQSYPDSPKIGEAKAALGRINTGSVFSPTPSPGKMTYAVSKGDSLVKIAAKLKSNAELIFRVNNMQTINLQIGQQLLIPQLEMSVVVDRKTRTITLFNGGEFFKEYQILASKTPAGSGRLQTKVTDKIALKGSKRVAFGDKNYFGSERLIMLGSGGLSIRGLPEGSENTPPPGIIVSQPDIEEIFVLVSRGTPVNIQ